MNKRLNIIIMAALSSIASIAQSIEYLKFGDMNQWVTRHIHESAVIGGNDKTVYAIGPTQTIEGNKAYTNLGGSPWATSNVYARVSGVTKTSNAVYPFSRAEGDNAARLTTQIEQVKVLGLINMDVMVAGSMFLGQMFEPITSTKNPYSKMEMGVKYTSRPKALVFDYKVDMPAVNTRVKSTGFSSKKTLPGHDNAVVFVFLQRRWEDAEGNIHAKRVGTGGRLFTKSSDWVNGYQLPIFYGDISKEKTFQPFLALRDKDDAYCARNSKGKLMPVIEEGWDDPSAQPTHLVVMFSAGSGEPFIGTEGLTLYIDNVGLKK
ncbi:MAG: PCMD domain-containing protein [Lachnoclostridium sp.]|nr:PCMD domain-containing protein [Lachnoclostridium sp.]